MRYVQDLKLVFYSNAPDGVLLELNQYIELLKVMSVDDFDTHIAVDVDVNMRKDVEALINISRKAIKSDKAS